MLWQKASGLWSSSAVASQPAVTHFRECSKLAKTLGTKAARSETSTRGEDEVSSHPSCLLVIVRPQMTVNSGGGLEKLTFGKGTKLSVESSKC